MGPQSTDACPWFTRPTFHNTKSLVVLSDLGQLLPDDVAVAVLVPNRLDF